MASLRSGASWKGGVRPCQMAAVSPKVGSRWHATEPAEPADEILPPAESLLPVPESLAEALPAGLPRGTVAVLSGARSLPVGIAAAVSAAGGHVAIVGLPDFGLRSAPISAAMVPQPGSDPVEVAAVLMDGMDLVLLGLAGRRVPATRARAVVARARQRGCTLLIVSGDWQGAAMRMEARVRGYEITAGTAGVPVAGCGRIGGVQLSVRARRRT